MYSLGGAFNGIISLGTQKKYQKENTPTDSTKIKNKKTRKNCAPPLRTQRTLGVFHRDVCQGGLDAAQHEVLPVGQGDASHLPPGPAQWEGGGVL